MQLETWKILDLLFNFNYILFKAKNEACCKIIEFAAACSNPSGCRSNFKFGRRIRLPKGMLQEKFRSNLSHTSWDMAICNKFWSKMLHFAATQWTENAPPLPIWKRRSKYTTMSNFIFSAGNEAYICTPPNYKEVADTSAAKRHPPPTALLINKTSRNIASEWLSFVTIFFRATTLVQLEAGMES